MSHQLEQVVVEQISDILFRAGEEIINTQNFMALLHQPLAQVRAYEAGTSGYEDAIPRIVGSSRQSGVNLS